MIGPFDHSIMAGLFGDKEMAALWSAEAQLSHMLAFEAAWSRAGALANLWTAQEGEAAAHQIASAKIAPSDVAAGMGEDGVCVPSLVGLLRSVAGETAVHLGATSQDVIDTAMAMCARDTIALLKARIGVVEHKLSQLIDAHGEATMMGYTRMQAALPMKTVNRLQSWRRPLVGHLVRLDALQPHIACLQIGGAVGDNSALGGKAGSVAEAMASSLDLRSAGHSWHNQRENVAEFACLLSLVTGSIGKMGQDICLMAQQGDGAIVMRAGGGSSAMPHKQNPVLAELLVTLARFNAVQVSGMHQILVHEQERSGAAWALEWMILPQMAMAAGRCLVAASALIDSIEKMGQ